VRGRFSLGDVITDDETAAYGTLGSDTAALSPVTPPAPPTGALPTAPPSNAGRHPAATPDVGPHPGAGGWVLADRYEMHDRVGAGAMAEVFRARDRLLGRDVAVKVFRSQTEIEGSLAGRQRQAAELQALAQLSHPNLITLYDGSVSGEGQHAYLVMELIDGPSLAGRIAEQPLPEVAAREVVAQIADALSYVHSRSMVHRDVKPANILLGSDVSTGDETVRARLSDFGIVRLVGSERLTSVDFMVGTASYLAPEQARGVDVGPPADVYALGLVLIEALTGQRSFDGPPLEAVMARLSRPPEIPAHLDRELAGLLAAMTAYHPSERPTAAEVAAALRGGRFTERPIAAPLMAAGPAGAAVGLAPVGGAAAALPTDLLSADGADLEFADGPRGPMRMMAMFAVGLIAVILVGGYLLLHGSSPKGSTPGAGSGATATVTVSAPKKSSAAPTTAAATTSAPSSSSTAAPTTSAPSSTSAAPTTSAASTSAAPSSASSTASAASSAPSSSGASAAAGSVSPSTTTTTPQAPTPPTP
jgi:serine/threonine protein kinase